VGVEVVVVEVGVGKGEGVGGINEIYEVVRCGIRGPQHLERLAQKR
jgi:hypothetical protein